MNDFPSDDKRLDATEAQMRRALGLQGGSSLAPQPTPPIPAPSGSHRPPRRFVRDGEVPVTIIHRDENSGTNQLEAARQTIRSLTAAKEQAERLLGEAQTAIRDLQTKLAHERLARVEAVSRGETDRQASEQTLQSVQADLAEERGARRQAEQGLAEALEGRQEAEERLRDVLAAQVVQAPFQASVKGRPRRRVGRAAAMPPPNRAAGDMEPDNKAETHAAPAETARKPKNRTVAPPETADGNAAPRRGGRAPKVQQPDAEVVEWWLPGWKERLR
jgi:hypothetical protein